MRQTLRSTVLFAAAVFMGFSAFVSAIVSVPHFREDMEEINVRPTLLGAVMLGLHFSTMAMFALTCLVLVAAFRSLRSGAIARAPLLIIAVTYLVFGVAAYLTTGSHHTLGYIFISVLIAGAIATREPR